MKHATKLQPQEAYVTRRGDYGNSLAVQQEAAVLAFQNGDMAEMKRREASIESLKARRQRRELKPLPGALIQALGPRDAIANMLKTRFLEERHGRTALQLRDYMVARTVHMGGSGDLIFVEGKQGGDLADKIHGLRQGQRAVAAGQATLPSKTFLKPVTGLLCGFVTLSQAGRQVGGRAERVQGELKNAVRVYLEAAGPFFG